MLLSDLSGSSRVPWESVLENSFVIINGCFPGVSDRTELRLEVQRAAHRQANFDEADTVRHRAAIDARLASWQEYERIFQQVKRAKLDGGAMPDVDFDRLADRMNPQYGYETPRKAFIPTWYQSFDDWFLRSLSSASLESCRQRAVTADVCAPVQAVVAAVPSGLMTLKVSLVVVEELLGLFQGAQLVQFSLRKTDYHHVHCPVDGLVESVDACSKDQLFPGSEAMTVISIRAAFGRVHMLCIGEWSVQSFITNLVAGQEVCKMLEVGHFDFGSQVLLVLPSCVKVRVGGRVFPGDPVGCAPTCLDSRRDVATADARQGKPGVRGWRLPKVF